MKKYDYSYTDKAIALMSKEFIRLFNKAKMLARFDEANVLGESNKLYEKLLELAKKYFLLLTKNTARQVGGKASDITTDWLLDYLEEFDPITGYVFLNECERKRARFFESYISTKGDSKTIDRQLSLWDRMCRQYAIELTDASALKEYKDNGVKKVQWIHGDRCTCEKCEERNLKIYSIDKIPSKPHINCRCTIIPYE